METSGEKLAKAISHIKGGNKHEGARILANLLTLEPNIELAWIWLADCAESRERKIQCLQKAIQLNPKRASTQRALVDLMCVSKTISTIRPEEIQAIPPILDTQSHTSTIKTGQENSPASKQETIAPSDNSKLLNKTTYKSVFDDIRERNRKYFEEQKRLEEKKYLEEIKHLEEKERPEETIFREEIQKTGKAEKKHRSTKSLDISIKPLGKGQPSKQQAIARPKISKLPNISNPRRVFIDFRDSSKKRQKLEGKIKEKPKKKRRGTRNLPTTTAEKVVVKPDENLYADRNWKGTKVQNARVSIYEHTLIVDDVRINPSHMPDCLKAGHILSDARCERCDYFSPLECIFRYKPYFLKEIRFFISNINPAVVEQRKKQKAALKAIYNELRDHGRPLHYSVLAQIVQRRHPNLGLTEQRVLRTMTKHPEIFENVDKGVYQSKKSRS